MTQAQSPWARSKGGGYAQLSWNYIPTYTNLFGEDGTDVVLSREVSERSLQFYGEYGLAQKTSLMVALPYVWNERGEVNPKSNLVNISPGGEISGLGNTTIGLKHQFLSGKLAMAGNLRVQLPAGASYQQESDLRTGFDAATIIPSLSAGMGFGITYWYAYGGYGYRTNNYTHFVTFGGEAGLKVGKVWVGAFTESIIPLENGSVEPAKEPYFTGLFVDNQGWVSYGVKASWAILPSLGINFSGAGAAWAQNVPKSPGISLGAWYRWGQ
ncbi:MAG TPA: hypothetical protein DCF33_12230 [Saprospirales bacterium]|nr:hypothetical protein [Saprospirales bacterium]